ncbi:DUF3298 domain-containing protein [Taylorella asinigenitalis]|uniref:DUF3298 domain-containing protein n=1 Tax=Taylorella asinigenitalis TaxID=84590 RepID=UPI00048A8170|nr:DUF3298 domain-containing protein [Taylorella asinigenitalis]
MRQLLGLLATLICFVAPSYADSNVKSAIQRIHITQSETSKKLSDNSTCSPECPVVEVYFIETNLPEIDAKINLDILELLISFDSDNALPPEKYTPETADAIIRGVFKKLVAHDKSNSMNFAGASEIKIEPKYEHYWDEDENNRLLDFYTEYSYFLLGSPQPSTGIFMYTYDIKKGFIILADLVGQKNVQKVKDLAYREYVRMNKEKGIQEPFLDKQHFYLSNNFMLTADELRFVYDPGSINSIAKGSQTIMVPRRLIQPLLEKGYKNQRRD